MDLNYTIHQDERGFYFVLRLQFSKVNLLFGNTYKNYDGAKRGIDAQRKYLHDPEKYILRANAFSLRAGNNREIGRSPKMEADQLEEVMDLLQKYGPDAVLIEADDRISASNETQLSNKES